MLIEEEALNHWIQNFYGYGSWRARFWFIGYEEGGGEMPEEVADRINYFRKAHPADTCGHLCDIRDLYKHVAMPLEDAKARPFATRHEYRFGEGAIQQSVWKNLISFVRGYTHEKISDPLEYQKKYLASASFGSEALIYLYPLPSPHNHAWYYSWLDLPGLQFIRSRTTYQENLYPTRIKTILSNIKEHKPDVVLMYGMQNINTLRRSVQEFFDSTKFIMVKAIKLQLPQYHVAELDGTTIVITTQIPTLRHNRVETGFNWEEFGRALKEKKKAITSK